jgi:hypothetical protein
MKSKSIIALIVVFIFICIIFVSAATQKNRAVQNWEYKSVRCDLPLSDINQLGSEGWEMANIMHPGDNCYIYFKRPL